MDAGHPGSFASHTPHGGNRAVPLTLHHIGLLPAPIRLAKLSHSCRHQSTVYQQDDRHPTQLLTGHARSHTCVCRKLPVPLGLASAYATQSAACWPALRGCALNLAATSSAWFTHIHNSTPGAIWRHQGVLLAICQAGHMLHPNRHAAAIAEHPLHECRAPAAPARGSAALCALHTRLKNKNSPNKTNNKKEL